MRWEDEDYLKLYRNPSPEFLALPWQSRGLFDELMKVVDRAGILRCGKLSPEIAVAVAVRGTAEDVRAHLRDLLDDGCLVFDDERRCLYIPNFVEAQSARQADKVRKQRSRESASASFKSAPRSPAVTDGHRASPDVTAGHQESPGVTSDDNQSPVVTADSSMVSENHVTSGHQESPAVTKCHSENRREEKRGDCAPSVVTLDEPPSATRLRAAHLDDHMGDEELAGAWAEGVTKGAGHTMAKPTRGQQQQLIDLAHTHGPERIGVPGFNAMRAWIRERGEAFGEAYSSRTRSVFAFGDWLNSGNASPPRRIEDVPDEAPLPRVDATEARLAGEEAQRVLGETWARLGGR